MFRKYLKTVGISVAGAITIYGISKFDDSKVSATELKEAPIELEVQHNKGKEVIEKLPRFLQNPPPIETLKLRCAQVFFRHGARTPIKSIPNIEEATYEKEFLMPSLPYATTDFEVTDLRGRNKPPSPYDANYQRKKLKGGCIAGQLTKLGQDQAYQLGRSLRKAYMENDKLISEEYSSQEVYLRSTNIKRTIKSAVCVMVGIFGDQYFEETGPVIVPVASHDQEILFPNPRYCDRLRHIARDGWHNMDDIPGVKEMRKYIQKEIDFDEGDSKHTHRLNLSDCRDDLTARQAHGLPVPEFLQERFDEIADLGTKVAMQAIIGPPSCSQEGLTLSSGPLLYQVNKNMELNMHNKSKHKLYLYSVHDSTLMPLMKAVGVFDNKWPPYSADLRFELYEDQLGDFWVRTMYLGEEAVMEKCNTSICRLEEFQDIISPYSVSVEQYRNACSHVKMEKIKLIEKIGRRLPKLPIIGREDEDEKRSDTAAGM